MTTIAASLTYDMLKDSGFFGKIEDGSLPSWAKGGDENPSDVYTWENAPDEGKFITKEILANTKLESESAHRIRFYQINNTVKVELNNWEHRYFDIPKNIIKTSLSSSGVKKVSEIKIGTDSTGTYILTLKNGSAIWDSWGSPISFKLTEGSYSNSN